MKTTLDVPDDLYRRDKARSALLGQSVREVTIELYQRWLGEAPSNPVPTSSSREWLDEWIGLGDTLLREAPDVPTASEIVADRRRLERR